jgi:hypothetical protein
MIRYFTEVTKKTDKVLRISQEKYLSVKETGYFSNSPVSIDTRGNNLADKVLKSGNISLNDPELVFKGADLGVIKDLGPDLLQTELGVTKSYSNDQILLEDVDPYNVPLDKDIILWPKKSKVIAIGKPVDSYTENNIERAIFHEEKPKYGTFITWKTYLKLLFLAPVFFYFAIYLEILREYYYVKSFYTALDRENMELLRHLKTIPESTIKTQDLLSKFYPDN